jgi:acyl-CoA hydrolase/RimJ/RimL family protein N-acetyltransferase
MDALPNLALLENKIKTVEEAVALVRPGQSVFVGTGCATPVGLIVALEARSPSPPDVEFVYFLTSGLGEIWGAGESRYRHRCFFVGSDVRALVLSGKAEYVPISLTRIPELTANGRIRPDVALIQVSPPDAHGFVSLGVSVDIAHGVLRKTATIIAEMNPNMPRTQGDSFLHVDRLTAVVPVATPLTEYQHPPDDDAARRIARYVSEIIDDGATIQIDLGRFCNEALRYLVDRKDLGVHSNVITSPLLDLIRRGVVTGRLKTLHPGKVVASFCLGDRALYDFLDGNPMFDFRPIEYVAHPAVVGQNARMVSLSQALAIDLTGQVCSDQFDGQFYSGVSTQLDFHRGAVLSPGGKSIVCLHSTTDDGGQSRIRSQLRQGEGVTLPRSDVHYVVTDYGMAYLFGKSTTERAIALIEIAHPDFREGLMAEAKALALVPKVHRAAAVQRYPVEEERRVTLRSGRDVLLRPARGGDTPAMQHLFHQMSEQDVYLRFFRKLSALSYEDAQRLCNVDFRQDVAFVAVVGPRDNEEVIGTGAYFLNPTNNLAEVAYMIAPSWQRTGLGSALQGRLRDHAVAAGVRGFVAEILVANVSMIELAKRLGEISVTADEETYHVVSVFPANGGAPLDRRTDSAPPGL